MLRSRLLVHRLRVYRDLPTTAHQQLGAPLIVICDNAPGAPGTTESAVEHDWLTLAAPPTYAPQFNPPRASGR